MNIKQYIASGILELYALGELSEAEHLEVSKQLKEYPELRLELEKIEQAMEALYRQAEIAPTPAAKDKLLDQMQKIEENSSSSFRFSIAASLSLAILSISASLFFYTKWQSSEEELLSLQNDTALIAEDLNQVNQAFGELNAQLQVLSSGAYVAVQLAGTANAPDSKATVYWNPSDNSVYLGALTMTSLTQEQQYQLWAIVDDVPVSIGVFDASENLWSQMQSFEGTPAAFAVTVEKRGGSESPSLETMQVLGVPEMS
jgi:anti-sigma-K factor RskA